MINIVCLKWGTKYGPEYVNRLYLATHRNTTVDFKFWCFTDDVTGIRPEITTAPLPYAAQLHSWWNKLNLFSADIPIPQGQQIFYIDLDTLITDNIDDLLQYRSHTMIILRDFYHGIKKTANLMGSGLMSWEHGRHNHVWERFITDPNQHIERAGTYGDQWWIEQQIPDAVFWQDLFPEQVVSFKLHCRKSLPESARIVCYHGRPSIPESMSETTELGKTTIAPQPWVAMHWRDSPRPCRVVYTHMLARKIFGMVGRCGGGYNSLWADWSAEGRQRRELIMQEYEVELDRICGHYTKLESSILAEGIRNPVVLTCGLPKRRPLSCLPPEMLELNESEMLLLEGTTGGSRLHIAQKHNMTIPCLINDWTGRFDHLPEITHGDMARHYYQDQPESITIDRHGMITESFDDSRISRHLGEAWSEDRLMPLRAPMWINIMKKHGYTIERLSSRVRKVLGEEYQIPVRTPPADATPQVLTRNDGPPLVVRSFLSSLPKKNNSQEKIDALTYFAQGARACGDDADVTHNQTHVPCDVGVIIGNISSGDRAKTRLPHYIARKSVIDTQTQTGRYWLAIDSNIFIYRDAKNPQRYLRYSFNGVFPATGIYCNESPGEENWQRIRQHYRMDLRDWRTQGEHILFCLQRPQGWSMRGRDLMQWLDRTFQEVRRHSDRPIRLRWHPGDWKNFPQGLDLTAYGVTMSEPGVPLQQDLQNCWAVVCHNSTPSAVAVIEGIPAFITDDPGYCQAGEVANTDFARIESPVLFDREHWIRKIAQCHWSFEDLRSGRCWSHMRQWVQPRP